MSALDRLSASVGVVFTPPKLEKEVLTFVFENLFAYWRDSFKKRLFGKDDQEKYNDAWTLFNYYVKQENITLPKESKVTSQGFWGKEFELDLSLFPKQYTKHAPRFKKFMVVLFFKKTDFAVRYTTKGSYASFGVSKDGAAMLKVNLFNMNDLDTHKENPFTTYDKIISLVKDTIEHELSHMVQEAFLYKFPKQNKMLEDYHEEKDGYMLSPVEFSSILKDTLNEFVRNYKLIHGHLDRKGEFATPVNEAIRIVTDQLSEDEWFEPHHFFKLLKTKQPKQYKKALKFFTEEATKRLSEFHFRPTFKRSRFK